MTMADLPTVHRLSARLHPDHPERPDVLAEKFDLFPRGCFVLDGAHLAVGGYCFSHPWTIGPPPALDTFFGRLPAAPTRYFIHDLALDHSVQGQGHAGALMPSLLAVARAASLPHMMLVAVKGTEPFWERMGFRTMDDATLQAAARAGYGDGAVQMERDLA